jgi:hypothetical protein
MELMDVSLKWRMIGFNIVHANSNKAPTLLSVTEFKVYFKLIPELVEYAYAKLIESYSDVREEHLLWTLHFLKSGPTNETVMANVLGTNRNTMMLHVQETVEKLFNALPEVCSLVALFFSNF